MSKDYKQIATDQLLFMHNQQVYLSDAWAKLHAAQKFIDEHISSAPVREEWDAIMIGKQFNKNIPQEEWTDIPEVEWNTDDWPKWDLYKP